MIPVTKTHIWLDDRGVAWIYETNVKVIEVAAEWRYSRMSPEQMVDAHDGSPNLAQTFAALAYYVDHQAEFDAEMDRLDREYMQRWAQNLDSPIRRKLRALGKIP